MGRVQTSLRGRSHQRYKLSATPAKIVTGKQAVSQLRAEPERCVAVRSRKA